MLIDSFRSFLLELGEFPIGLFNVWIDGSFVTRKEHPNDLDAVVFLPAREYESVEQELRRLRNEFAGLDIYFVKVIEAGSPSHFLYVSDYTEWLFQFTTIRPHKSTGRKSPKGFLDITLTNEQPLDLIW